MRLLVTGASGFIGKNLLLKAPKNWDVVATYYKSEDFPDFVKENSLKNVQAIRVNLESARETKEKLDGFRFDCVVHLAANTDTMLSVKNPEKDFRSNVLALLNAVKATKIKDLIFLSSGTVYDEYSGFVSPRKKVNPSLPYAVSKLACENYVSYFKRYGLIEDYVILRFFGAYGPFESPRKIFTKLVKAFYFDSSNEFQVVGDGNNFIDAMYIDDAVRGILAVVKSDVRDVTVDFACGTPLTINQLVTRVAEIFGRKNVKMKHVGEPVEYIRFYVSSSDMKRLYRFEPLTSLEEGIWKLAKWLEKKKEPA